ncbi:hypothetical protein RHSIM_Rhsim07G0083400 [Rhododendron simsii]|uniref:Uncharacterized protein n=1 Tax=Rhododendron simsii TaxID=118357 RepID=A0A834LJF7_RHOSS|nr:hypothetical protein RHSIM_Rhsim07G0083400 [Rhododendron simsii]
MEKIQEQKEKHTQKTNDDHNPAKPQPLVWDCGSSLYDSFELKSFERQLDSAIASRTLSMPHRAHHHAQPKPISKKSSSKFSRPFHKLVKSVFGPKENASSSLFSDLEGSSQDHGFYFVYDKSGSLSTIPEVAEKAAEYGSVLPDSDESLVKRAASERFTATSVGVKLHKEATASLRASPLSSPPQLQQTMEKIQQQKEKQTPKTVWDCGSTLYDSFELKSFERQLDSAIIASRTLSMQHLPVRRAHLPPPTPQPKPISKKPYSKFSRSFHKLLKSVFGPKQNASSSLFSLEGSQQDGVYVVCSSSGSSLSSIPEVAEYGGVSPDLDKSLLVKRSASERFTATSVVECVAKLLVVASGDDDVPFSWNSVNSRSSMKPLPSLSISAITRPTSSAAPP